MATVALLFERHNRGLMWYLTNMMASREDAEDVAQEAYIRLLTTPHLDPEERRARNYLYKVATNLARDWYRRRRARRDHLRVSLETLELDGDGPSPDSLLALEQGLSLIGSALHESSPRPRNAFLLHVNDHLTYQQIADELGVSKKTVERDIAVTLELCRERLESGRRLTG